MFTIGVDRIGIKDRRVLRSVRDECPTDHERGVFRGASLVCPRCARILGGI